MNRAGGRGRSTASEARRSFVADGLDRLGAGAALPTTLRQPMERQLGHDLSRVRVHHDEAAAQLASAVRARAFAYGDRVVFGRGEWAPETATGRHLLGHELAHVVQQATGGPNVDGRDADAEAEGRVTRAPTGRPMAALPTITTPVVQRYPVPADLACHEVVDWLDTNSPYAPEWAETRCSITFEGSVRTNFRTLGDGSVELRARGHRGIKASVDCPVDRPEWSPSPRPGRAAQVRAWQAMRRVLDAHENEHRAIGRTWKATLQARYRAIDLTVTGVDQADATQQATDRIAALEAQWQLDAQAAQDAIDPFRGAVLACPEEATP